MDILERVIKILDDGCTYPNYFENLFLAQPRRWLTQMETCSKIKVIGVLKICPIFESWILSAKGKIFDSEDIFR
jgi:hypothetical protein